MTVETIPRPEQHVIDSPEIIHLFNGEVGHPANTPEGIRQSLDDIASGIEEGLVSGVFTDYFKQVDEPATDELRVAKDYLCKSPELSVDETVRLLGGLWSVYKNKSWAWQHLIGGDGSYTKEDVVDGAQGTASTLLSTMLPSRLDMVRDLAKENDDIRELFDAACEFKRKEIATSDMYEGLGLAFKLSRMRSLARLQGYDSLLSKKAAIDIGEIGDDGLTQVEAWIDSLKDPMGPYQEDVVFSVLTDTVPTPTDVFAAAYERLKVKIEGEEVVSLDAQMTTDWLCQTVDTMRHISPEDAKLLRETCGIVDFANVPLKTLDRMVRFAHGDEELLDKLRENDVCVVIRDGSNDHNGALSNVFADFETKHEATLAFEIPIGRESSVGESAADRIHRTAKLLQERDIKPSLVVVAAHGAPGSVMMGDSQIGIREGAVSFEDSGLLDIFEDMKPDEHGNCSIVFAACSQDAPVGTEVDDTTIVKAAIDIRNIDRGGEAAPGTYQVYGVDIPSPWHVGRDGSVGTARAFNSLDDPIMGHIIVAESGTIRRYFGPRDDDTDRSYFKLPMLPGYRDE